MQQQVRSRSGAADIAFATLIARIAERRATVAVIGLGYVGLPLSCALAGTGNRVIGYDIDPAKAEQLNAGRSYIRHIADENIRAMREKGFEATADVTRLAAADAILICVPTPLSRNREPDLTFIVSTAESWCRIFAQDSSSCSNSTTYPGTTTEVMKPILERSGLRAEETSSSPTGPSARTPAMRFRHLDDPQGRRRRRTEARQRPYCALRPFVETVPVSSTATAEAVKLTENIFRAVNIALVNELKVVYEAMGIDVWEVIDAAKTKPFGFMPFYPGPGPRRPLHPDRPVLPHLEGARVRAADALHRACRRDQHGNAAGTWSTALADALDAARAGGSRARAS